MIEPLQFDPKQTRVVGLGRSSGRCHNRRERLQNMLGTNFWKTGADHRAPLVSCYSACPKFMVKGEHDETAQHSERLYENCFGTCPVWHRCREYGKSC